MGAHFLELPGELLGGGPLRGIAGSLGIALPLAQQDPQALDAIGPVAALRVDHQFGAEEPAQEQELVENRPGEGCRRLLQREQGMPPAIELGRARRDLAAGRIPAEFPVEEEFGEGRGLPPGRRRRVAAGLEGPGIPALVEQPCHGRVVQRHRRPAEALQHRGQGPRLDQDFSRRLREAAAIILKPLPHAGEEVLRPLPEAPGRPGIGSQAPEVGLVPRQLAHQDQIDLDPAQMALAQQAQQILLLLALHFPHQAGGVLRRLQAAGEFQGARVLGPDDLQVEMLGQGVEESPERRIGRLQAVVGERRCVGRVEPEAVAERAVPIDHQAAVQGQRRKLPLQDRAVELVAPAEFSDERGDHGRKIGRKQARPGRSRRTAKNDRKKWAS